MKLKLFFTILASIAFSFSSIAQVSKNESAAREWINDHSGELNIQSFHTFKLSFVRKGLAGETLRFQQMLNDVPVFGAEIVINFANENTVAYSSNSYDDKIANITTTPSISKSQAIAISDSELKYKEAVTFQEAKLYVMNIDGTTKLVYRVVTNAHDITGSWEVIIDAATSAILSKKDIRFITDIKKKNPKILNNKQRRKT